MVVHTIRVINPTIHVRIREHNMVHWYEYKAENLPWNVRNVYELASWMHAHVRPLPRPLEIRINGLEVSPDHADPYFRHNDMIDFFPGDP